MKILFAMDCSDGSQDLVAEVLRQAWPKDSQFDVLHVGDAGGSGHEPSRAAVSDALFSLQENGFAVRRQYREGDPKQQILQYAEQEKPDLILVGARRMANLSRILLGSVSAAVVRHAHCSVQIVRPKSQDWRTSITPRLLLATDGSPNAFRSAEAIAKRPWPSGTEICLAYVAELIEPPTLTLLTPKDEGFPPNAADFAELQHIAQIAFSKARHALATLDKVHIKEELLLVTSGARHALLEFTEHWAPDVLFVGSRGISGFERLLLGSVSEALATAAGCSVEVVR